MADHCCKIGAATATYDLRAPGDGDVDEYLAARWTGADSHSAVGYRALADWFNQRLLRTVYLEHDRSATEARIESEYEALRGDDDLRRREVLDDLAADGIDAEALRGALVSRSTMARHLKSCLGLEKPSEPRTDRAWELDKIEHGRQAFRRSATEAVRSLANKGRLAGGATADLELPVLLSCHACATRVSLRTALDQGYVCADHSEEPPNEG